MPVKSVQWTDLSAERPEHKQGAARLNGPCALQKLKAAGYYNATGLNVIATPFMQYRNPVGLGPSSKTCPR